MVTRADIQIALEEATHLGADFAEIYLEDKDELTIHYDASSVQGIAKAHHYGAGLYLIAGTNSTYVYTNHVCREELLKLARIGNDMLRAKSAGICIPLSACVSRGDNPCPVLTFPSAVSNLEKIRVLENSYKAAMSASPYIRGISLAYFDVDQRVSVFNSEGLWVEDHRVTTRLRRSPKLQSGSRQLGYFSDFTRSCGFEAFADEGYIASIVGTVKDMEETLFADDAPVGLMPVIFEAGDSSGTFFHEACGHALETSTMEVQPTFRDRLKTRIASEKVTLIDDGTLPHQYGSSAFDDEGMLRQKNILIKDGVLESYLVDRLGSIRFNIPRTGSGRRQGYAFAPCARMSNTYLAPGSDDDDEMIRSLPEGLLVTQIGGGVESGGFSLAAQKAYLIRNGQIDRPVRGAIVSGKCEESMRLIDRVGKKLVYEDDGAFCGAGSGLVNTTTSGARMRVSEMMVGGTGGAE